MSENKEMAFLKTFVFISGAGQGFGRACALSAASMFRNECLILLCGRHIESLNETENMIKDRNPQAEVKRFTLDLNNVNEKELYKTFERILVVGKCQFENYIVIHNAGSIGDVTKYSDEHVDEESLGAFFRVNVTGTIVVNTSLLRRVREVNGDSGAPILVVNVSSLAAVQPMPTMSMYCTAKAAREMFFQCLATEWSSRHSQPLWVVSYAPGPMETAMMTHICEHSAGDSTKTFMKALRANGGVLDPLFSSDKLFHDVICRHELIESGSRLDVYDI